MTVSAQTTRPVLAEAAFGAAAHPARQLVLVAAGTLILALSARIAVPFYPVPMTLQTGAVLLIGAWYGPRLGALTMLAYLAEGALGLPVFAGGSGLAYMMGPTGGYLAGFVLAAAAVGWLARRGWDRSVALMAAAMLLGTLLIYVPGLLWLGAVIGWDKPLLSLGLVPFLPGDVLKLVLAALAGPLAWRLAGR